MYAVAPFYMRNIGIEKAIWIGAKPYFMAEDIGKWLGYSHPDRAVRKIVKRNPYIKEFSKIVELEYVTHEEGPDQIGPYPIIHSGFNLVPESSFVVKTRKKVRVFDPIGVQLIVFESKQKKAQQYKIAVAKLVLAYLRGELLPVKVVFKDIEAALMIALSLSPQERTRVIQEIMRRTGKSRSTIYAWMKALREGRNPLVRRPSPGRHRVITPEIRERIKMISEECPYCSAREIWRRLGGPESPSYRTIIRFMKKFREEE